MTVKELILLLEALPEHQKNFEVGFTYDTFVGDKTPPWNAIYGICDIHEWIDEDGDHHFVRLQGE